MNKLFSTLLLVSLAQAAVIIYTYKDEQCTQINTASFLAPYCSIVQGGRTSSMTIVGTEGTNATTLQYASLNCSGTPTATRTINLGECFLSKKGYTRIESNTTITPTPSSEDHIIETYRSSSCEAKDFTLGVIIYGVQCSQSMCSPQISSYSRSICNFEEVYNIPEGGPQLNPENPNVPLPTKFGAPTQTKYKGDLPETSTPAYEPPVDIPEPADHRVQDIIEEVDNKSTKKGVWIAVGVSVPLVALVLFGIILVLNKNLRGKIIPKRLSKVTYDRIVFHEGEMTCCDVHQNWRNRLTICR